MDLMRMLLIYMSATMTLAVQSTAAPRETPAPSPVPPETVITETAETPLPGDAAAEVITPGPTGEPAGEAVFTPVPVPTITPNTRGYHNLGMGAKGKEVRKLQEKLIEMGYLPEGSADGAYGRQTYNAVKKFQYYNGLKQDGVAGRATQTNLFENPDAARNPEAAAAETAGPEVTETPEPEVTATPELTATPEPEPTETPEPEPTETPEPEPTETPEPEPTETPEPEVTGTPEPEPTETPEPEVTETPEPEPTETPEPEVTETPEPEVTETPEPEPTETPEPEVTESPEPEPTAEQPAEKPEEDPAEVIENVDLDADVYELLYARIALNEGEGPLSFVAMEDGVPVTAYPRLSQSGARIRVSLDDLCECVESWRLTDDGVGSVVLEAAGYTLALYNEDKGCSATLDGTEIPMTEDDFDFASEGHFINAAFLASALKGEAVWDQEENTLMLRIRDKAAAEAAD